MKIKQTTFMANVTNVGIGDLTKNEGKTIIVIMVLWHFISLTLSFSNLHILLLFYFVPKLCY